MWVVAHRGGAELYPENSITAFTELAKQGVDLVECDVHLSLDGQLMVIHDDNLRRTAGVDRRVSEMTREELATVDIGDGYGVPSLTDVLDAVTIPVVVELKTRETVHALDQLLQGNQALQERIVPLSFFHDILRFLSTKHPALTCGALLAGYPVDPAHVAASAGCKMLSFHHEGLQAEYVERCHAGGVMVSVWAPSTEEDIRRSIAVGVDGIGSDRPDLVLQLLAEAEVSE